MLGNYFQIYNELVFTLHNMFIFFLFFGFTFELKHKTFLSYLKIGIIMMGQCICLLDEIFLAVATPEPVACMLSKLFHVIGFSMKMFPTIIEIIPFKIDEDLLFIQETFRQRLIIIGKSLLNPLAVWTVLTVIWFVAQVLFCVFSVEMEIYSQFVYTVVASDQLTLMFEFGILLYGVFSLLVFNSKRKSVPKRIHLWLYLLSQIGLILYHFIEWRRYPPHSLHFWLIEFFYVRFFESIFTTIFTSIILNVDGIVSLNVSERTVRFINSEGQGQNSDNNI